MADHDLFGNVVEKDVILRESFIEPPFSILDTRQGSWQNRKRKWMALGIKSEIGRKENLTFTLPMGKWDKENMDETYVDPGKEVGTSVFDPALCEIMYKWFAPEGGTILDPFAGGSVRGVVANYLGFKYTGIELRPEQVESNREQSLGILPKDNQPIWFDGDSDAVMDGFFNQPTKEPDNKVKISLAFMRQKFQPCEPDYIANVCHGRCCQGSEGLMVTVHSSEIFEDSPGNGVFCGAKVKDNFIVDEAGTGICPFKKDHLCSIHEDKPFGCKASPFTINKNNTLIIRNRYRLLKCYNTPEGVPAYIAHRWSLDQIFGREIVEEMIPHLENGTEDFYVRIPMPRYKMMIENDIAKHPDRQGGKKFDFVFSCPPYADLEVYSDLPEDLSNMDYKDFVPKYRSIIKKSVQLLKKGGYACFVVGEVRDKDGYYYDFVGDTKRAFIENGAKLYNDAILMNAVGSASMRAKKIFESGKKLTKIHQNILIFKKV